MDRSRKFYEEILGAKVGRVKGRWLDVWLYDVQITLQDRRGEEINAHEKFHFGATLEWEGWERMHDHLQSLGAEFDGEPAISEALGQAKLYLKDPDGYVVELKAYRDRTESLAPPD